MGKTTSVFMSDGSQAVRLPEEFRFECEKVSIRREGDAVILEPAPEPPDEWAWLDNLRRPADEDFLRAALEAGKWGDQPRPEIDELFR